MNIHKLFVVLLFIALGILLVSVLWKHSIILSLSLILIAYVKHKVISIKKEFQWFVVAGIVGAVGESLIMNSGPWKYTRPNIFNFPIWLVFLWGYAGTVGISLYQAIAKSK
jgi:hypothetical protein